MGKAATQAYERHTPSEHRTTIGVQDAFAIAFKEVALKYDCSLRKLLAIANPELDENFLKEVKIH